MEFGRLMKALLGAPLPRLTVARFMLDAAVMPSEFPHISALRPQSILNGFVGASIMEEAFALLRTHHKNVQRYRQLLQTSLTDFEREYIGGRLREEQLAIEMLSPTLPSETSPSDPRAG